MVSNDCETFDLLKKMPAAAHRKQEFATGPHPTAFPALEGRFSSRHLAENRLSAGLMEVGEGEELLDAPSWESLLA